MHKKQLIRFFISIVVGVCLSFILITEPVDFSIHASKCLTSSFNNNIALVLSMDKLPTTLCCAIFAAMLSKFLNLKPLLYSIAATLFLYLSFITFTVNEQYEIEVVTINWLLFLIVFFFTIKIVNKVHNSSFKEDLLKQAP
jgi:competence CoiA-like predicted nuclease